MSDRGWRALFQLGVSLEAIAETLHVPLCEVEAAYHRLVASRWAIEEASRQLRSSWGARLRCR